MTDKHYALGDAPEYIYLQDGKIVHQSIFEKNFDGDLKLLLSCVADNIYDYYDGANREYIDWSLVIDCYNAVMRPMASHKFPHLLTFYTTYKMHDELRLLSEATGMGIAELMREAVQLYIDGLLEDTDDIPPDIQRKLEVLRGTK